MIDQKLFQKTVLESLCDALTAQARLLFNSVDDEDSGETAKQVLDHVMLLYVEETRLKKSLQRHFEGEKENTEINTMEGSRLYCIGFNRSDKDADHLAGTTIVATSAEDAIEKWNRMAAERNAGDARPFNPETDTITEVTLPDNLKNFLWDKES